MGADHPVSWCKDYKGGRSFYTARRQHRRRASPTPTSGSTSTGAIDWAAGQCRPGLQRLRRDRARELPAGQDQRPAEPERADRLRPAPGRTDHPDRPPRRRAAAQPGDRHDAGDRQLRRPDCRTASTRTARTASTARRVDNNFATNHWVYLYYAPLVVDNITLLGRHDRAHERLLGDLDRRRPRPRPSISALWTPGSATSSSRASSSSTTPGRPGAPRSRDRAADPARPEQPRRLLPRGRRHRLRQAQQPLVRHG